MRLLMGFAIAISALAIFMFRDNTTPTAEEIVAASPAELYARYDGMLGEIERKAATTTTVTGTPPYPVKFAFARRDGRMLDMTGTAGFRKVEVKAWFDDGDRPGETKLKVMFEPESLFAKSGDKELHRALETILRGTSDQFIQGRRITTLFGGKATPD